MLADLLGPSRVVAAPMAGGPSTPELVRAASDAGGLGLLAAGYKSVAAVAAELDEVAGTARFGVNLFVPGPRQAPSPALAAYRAALVAEAPAGVEIPEPDFSDTDGWDAKLALLLERKVPLVSFTFGLPTAEEAGALRDAGTLLLATVTSVAEAVAAEALGVDGLCVQGPEAGGHRGTHDPSMEPGTTPLAPLMRQVSEATRLPLIAAGGIATADDARAAIAAGASAVQAGTAFLLCPEAGTSPVHRAALTDPRFQDTAMTRAFSGRVARGLVNGFMLRHADAPPVYPQVNQLTGPLRRHGAAVADPDLVSLWAGLRWRDAAPRPAREVVERLAAGSA